MLAKYNKLLTAIGFRINKKNPTLFLSTFRDVIQEQKIKVGTNYINYVKVGRGPHHVLFMPGALGTIWTNYKTQVEEFDREKFTVVAWDPPGYGKSRPPEKKFDNNFFEEEADDMYKFMQSLNIPKYSVLGWSGGSVTTMIHAAKYQNVVQKLVILSGFSFVAPQDVDKYEKKKDIEQWSKIIRDAMIGVYGKELSAKYCYEWMSGMLDLSKKNNGKLCLDLLEDIQCPTFILHGAKDPLISKDYALHLHSCVKGSQMYLYPEGKHNIHYKYADDFNKRVQDFLLI